MFPGSARRATLGSNPSTPTVKCQAMKLTFDLVTKDNIQQSLIVLKDIFPNDYIQAEGHYHDFIDKQSAIWKEERFWEYFLVKDSNKCVGLTGLYNSRNQNIDEVWCGWYGVVPDERGRGLGRAILDWTIDRARVLGYKKFRLWTTTDDSEKKAQNLYEKVGLNIYNRERFEDSNLQRLYREINL